MADELSPAVGRRRLGAALRAHRLAAGRTLVDVAEHLACSAGKISRLEAALVAPNVSDVRVLLDLYGVPGTARESLLAVARRSRDRAWWNDYSDVLPADSATFFGLEDGAALIQEYSGGLVPGLLQVPEYARALMECAPGVDPATVARRIDLRLRRQRLLARSEPPRLHVVLDEAVLVDTVGGPAGAARQLACLVEAVEQHSITIQLLPTGSGAHPSKGGRFSILRFPDPADRHIVYLEHDRSNTFLDGPKDLDHYSDAFAVIADLARSPGESEQLLKAASTNRLGATS
ncbi:MAG: helix-turn-helix domain-containing protein [Pseudonocardia sp.]